MADLISRAAAINVFMSKPPEYYHDSYIVSELNSLPTVDAELVRHGRWHEKPPKYGHGKSRFSECSLCKALGRKSWKYCPGCGAKMEA